ncbi:MAG: isochorismatase family protein [Candidatus Hodarchaeota archaeon]
MLENTALAGVDAQYRLFIRETPIYKEDELLRKINGLIDDAHSASIPAFDIQHCIRRLIEDSVEWQLHPRLKADENHTFIIKRERNAFHRINLKEELDRRKINQLMILGI